MWLKNFVLSALAQRHRLCAVNLIVDNDQLKRPSIHIPRIADDPRRVQTVIVPYDSPASEQPLESLAIHDDRLFMSFADRVEEAAHGWPAAPMVRRFWTRALAARQRTRILGEVFSAARRACERDWGCHNWEVPLSALLTTPTVAEFIRASLEHLPRMHEVYNLAVRDYRRRHRLRSVRHPAPDLARDGDWLEAPFWACRAGSPRRERLFVRSRPGGWQMRAGDALGPEWSADADPAILLRFERDGFCIRTRAMTTTLIARLLVGDLFIHGIGGAKYDAVTDEIISRLIGIEPPEFLVATGTLRLPLPLFPADRQAAARLKQRVRAIEWNPQRWLDAERQAEHAALAAWQPATRTERRDRFNRLRELNARMRPMVHEAWVQAMAEAQRAETEAHANDVLSRRDYSFVLFPESKLRPFFAQVSQSE